MSAVKKLEDETVPETEKAEEPAWKKKKSDREKLVRLIRAKSFSGTLRAVIRKNMKGDGTSEEGSSEEGSSEE